MSNRQVEAYWCAGITACRHFERRADEAVRLVENRSYRWLNALVLLLCPLIVLVPSLPRWTLMVDTGSIRVFSCKVLALCRTVALRPGMAEAIAIFWEFRTILQVVYYSREHWLGKVSQPSSTWCF